MSIPLPGTLSVMGARAVASAAIVLLFGSISSAQQIVFSHRVYAARGRSYQQLWIWSADSGALTQLTHANRDHTFPACDPDGRHVFFFSDDDDWLKSRHWRFDRSTGREEPPAPSEIAPQRTPAPPAPDACDVEGSLSPDGTRVACVVKGTDILIDDARTRREIARVPFGQRYSNGEVYAPWPMELLWSPDGRTLLVGNYGENGGSTTHELDYFLLDLETKTWMRAFSGTAALWVTPTLIVYVTPRDLSPLTGSGTHSVWTAHLTAFNPVTHAAKPITSGLSNDFTPAICSDR